MKRLLFLPLLLVTGCIDVLDDQWFTPVKLDAYDLPFNEIPDELVEEVSFPGEQLEGDSEAPTLFGIWAHQCPGGGVTPECAPKPTIYYLHGNNNHILDFWDRVQTLWRMGHPVFIIDYRGFGLSTGNITEAGFLADTETGLEHVRDRIGDDAELIYYGMSLGTAATIDLAARIEPDAVILEAAFASAQAFIDDATGLGVGVDTFMESRFDSVGKVSGIAAPKLHMHGTDDDFVRFEFGELVFENAVDPKTFIAVDGAGHGNVPCPELPSDVKFDEEPCKGNAAYVSSVEDFVDDLF